MPELLPRFADPACVTIAGDESVKDIGEDGDDIGECEKSNSVEAALWEDKN